MNNAVAVARKYINQQEKAGNKGFKDMAFEAKMKRVGWKPLQAWCAYFMELVYKEAYPDKEQQFDVLFSPSAIGTYANFAGSSKFKVGNVPKPGCMVVWRYGSTWKGHIGLVTEVGNGFIRTIEGNTNVSGSREGTHVLEKRRSLQPKSTGLIIHGYIYV